MFFVSNIYTTAPDKFDTPLQKETYRTFDTLLEMSIIPIVNENDSVSYMGGKR